MQHIKQNLGCSINILSNTGFIKGKTLRKVLTGLGISEFVDFQLYSDETGMSKPNFVLFNLMINEVKARNANIQLNNIIHIGDNNVSDVGGAAGAGICSMLINSNQVSIKNLINNVSHVLIT